MQAIEVKFIGPTNTKGSRWKASCERGSLTVSQDYSLDAQGNAESACYQLCARFANEDSEKYGTTVKSSVWLKPKASGQTKNGTFVFVFI